jgi:hypothetical protein
MSLLDKITNFVGGGLFKEVKELVTAYLPPDVTPEKRAELAMALQELQAKTQHEAAQIALEQLKTEMADTQDARNARADSVMPSVITVMLTCMVCGLLYAVVCVDIRDSSKDLAFTLSRCGAVLSHIGLALREVVR